MNDSQKLLLDISKDPEKSERFFKIVAADKLIRKGKLLLIVCLCLFIGFMFGKIL